MTEHVHVVEDPYFIHMDYKSCYYHYSAYPLLDNRALLMCQVDFQVNMTVQYQ